MRCGPSMPTARAFVGTPHTFSETVQRALRAGVPELHTYFYSSGKIQPSFWTQKEAKTPRGNFPSIPLGTPKLLIPPQAKDKAQRAVSPLVKGGKRGNVNKRMSEIKQARIKKHSGDNKQRNENL